MRDRWRDGYIAVDWGTTNRRAYLVDSSGVLVRKIEDDRGVSKLTPEAFPAEMKQLRQQLGPLPLLLAGMVGSNKGWRQMPYVPCPAGAPELVAAVYWAQENAILVPGVSCREGASFDVMRGEEVQLVGAAAAGLLPARALVCHPGTHTKWVRCGEGRIESFKTLMTGELFALLRQHSILADRLGDQVEPGADFDAGVRNGLEGDPLDGLFDIRARFLLNGPARNDAAHLSGLLIGNDIRHGLHQELTVAVMGRPELTELYARALALGGCAAMRIDGTEAFLAGARLLVKRL